MEKAYISGQLDKDAAYIKKRFECCSDVVHRRLFIGEGSYEIDMVYMDSMADRDLVEGEILKSLMFGRVNLPRTGCLEAIQDFYLTTADAKLIDDKIGRASCRERV